MIPMGGCPPGLRGEGRALGVRQQGDSPLKGGPTALSAVGSWRHLFPPLQHPTSGQDAHKETGPPRRALRPPLGANTQPVRLPGRGMPWAHPGAAGRRM